MPTYEYQCSVCEHHFERREGFDADPVCDCPRCQNQARRLFRPAPIIFKGSGFYVTDYNGKSPSASENEAESVESEQKSKVPASTATPSADSAKEADD